MPCRDYMDTPEYQRDIQAKCDLISRIACKALQHIEDSGDGLEMLILKDPEIAKWWTAHKEADRQEQIRIKEEAEEKKIRKEALAKLSPKEKKVLGIR